MDFLSADFSTGQWLGMVAIFIWSGFVRSGIGFGGAALGLPLLLLVDHAPLFFLPIIGWHLLFFTTITAGGRLKHIDWGFVKHSMGWMIVPKIIGVIGLLALPTTWMVVFVFGISASYALSWLVQRDLPFYSPWLDRFFLLIGGYVSGASLVGAPLIASVAIRHVALDRYRDTLFALWFILVVIKLAALMVVGVDMQIEWALLFLGPAAIGHVIGLRLHDKLVKQDSSQVRRWLGAGLLVVSVAGLVQSL